MKSKEEILCAAIWYKDLKTVIDDIPSSLLRPINTDRGIVFCGHRHPHCLYQMVALTGMKQYEAGEEVQGFLTSKNRFINRKEAAELHKKNGGKCNYDEDTLYSEDLY